jgi:hypothetical protein
MAAGRLERLRSWFFLSLVIVYALGCGTEAVPPPATVPKPAEKPAVEKPLTRAERPQWRVGYQWQYAWTDPLGKGTVVKEVVREELFEGVPVYVVKRGASEDFYTKDTLGLLATVSAGRVTVKRSAPFQPLAWPMEVGKEWTNSYVVQREGEQSSETQVSRVVVSKIERVSVPAGSFDAFKTEIYNTRTVTLLNEYWYAPAVKWFVKSRVYNPEGVREENLSSFKLD